MKKTLKHFKLLLDVICKALLRVRKNLDTKKMKQNTKWQFGYELKHDRDIYVFNLYVHY